MRVLFMTMVLGLTFSLTSFASEDMFVEDCAAKVESTDRESGKVQGSTQENNEVKTKTKDASQA